MALYLGGGIIALIWLRAQGNGNSLTKQAARDSVNTVVEVAKGVGEAVGVEVVKPVAKVIAAAAAKPFIAIYSGLQLQFFMEVEAMGGIKLYSDGEKKLALEYMPNSVVGVLDGLPPFSQWMGVKAEMAARAVKAYRNNNNFNTYQPWGIQ